MFKIKYLLILSTLLSCSTYELKDSKPFPGERSVAATPANCSYLISVFLSSVKKAQVDSFHSKLAAHGYRIEQNTLFKGNSRVGEIEVISPRYLYEWQDKDSHDGWIANGGILKEDMDYIFSQPGQAYGKGFYVSLHPTDSSSYGSHLTIFKVDKPMMLITNFTRAVSNNKTFLNDLRRIGFAGLKGSDTWLNIINEDFLAKPIRIDQNVFDYTTKTFPHNKNDQLALYSQLALAGKKVPIKKIIPTILSLNGLHSFVTAPKLLTEAIKEMTPSEFNKIAEMADGNLFLQIYSRQYTDVGSLAEEDYQKIIKILLKTKNNINFISVSSDFFKEMVGRMSRPQFNQIANKSEAAFFVKLYSELILSGKEVSDDEYANIISAFIGPYVQSYLYSPEFSVKLISKMNYKQFSVLVEKGNPDYFKNLLPQFEYSRGFFDLFDMFDIATSGKIKTDESLSLQEMISYAKRYEETTSNINFEKIKTHDDFKKLLKKVFEIDYSTRSDNVVMTPFLKNKYTINISQNSYDHINKNIMLNLSEKKIMPDNSVDLMVSYLELNNLEALRPIFSNSEYKEIKKLEHTDEAMALKIMIDTLLVKFFDRDQHSKITTLLYGNPQPTAKDLYQGFVSLHPYDDGNGRAARLYFNWLEKNMDTSPRNLLNEADILLSHPKDKLTQYYQDIIFYAGKIWVLSSTSEEEMIKRAQLIIKNNPHYTKILNDLPYLKRRL